MHRPTASAKIDEIHIRPPYQIHLIQTINKSSLFTYNPNLSTYAAICLGEFAQV